MKISSKVVYAVGAVGLGAVILFVSIAQAGFTILAKESNEKVRVLPIEFKIDNEIYSYKLPEVGTLSSSPVYGLKRMRDRLWESFDSDLVEKAEMSLFIADKKMAEVIELSEQNKDKLALDGCIEAINKLKYTNKLLNEINYKDSKIKAIDEQIYRAGYAYKKIIEKSCSPLVNEIDTWNENYKKNTK